MNKMEFDWMKELEELRHKNKMEEISAEGESKKILERLAHQNALERGRIKSAEIRKTLAHKDSIERWKK